VFLYIFYVTRFHALTDKEIDMRKGELLSIGEVSKLTEVSVKSLRYYEKVGILKPAYTDVDSNYRYYTFKQTYLVELIKLSLELDIPLKELSNYIHDEEIMDIASFITYGKKVAEEKLKKLSEGLDFIERLEHMIIKQSEFSVNTVYKRKFPKRHYKKVPYDEAINIDPYEGAQLFYDASFSYDENSMPEYGILYESKFGHIQRYAIMEIGKKEKDCITVPAGEYLCYQTTESKIENIEDIFGHNVTQSYQAIEVEIFTGIYDVSNPPKELRLINL